jgi:hypothetical protein
MFVTQTFVTRNVRNPKCSEHEMFVTRNVRKPKLCVLSESYIATDGLPPILPACRQTLLPVCVFVTRDTVRHPRLFLLGKFVREPICSWREALVNRGSTVQRFAWFCLLGFYPSFGTFTLHELYVVMQQKKVRTWESGPYLRTGQRGPDPGRQISRGGILKKMEIEVWYAGKKKAVHEREI